MRVVALASLAGLPLLFAATGRAGPANEHEVAQLFYGMSLQDGTFRPATPPLFKPKQLGIARQEAGVAGFRPPGQGQLAPDQDGGRLPPPRREGEPVVRAEDGGREPLADRGRRPEK